MNNDEAVYLFVDLKDDPRLNASGPNIYHTR